MRVALMIETGDPGGAEHMLLNLAEGLARRGHEPVPVGPDDTSPWLANQFRARGFRPEHYTMRHLLDWSCLRGLVDTLRRRQVAIVHSHDFTMGVYGAAAAVLVRRPHVLTMHGGRYYAGKLQRRVALGWAARASGATVAVSNAVRDDLARTLHMGPRRIQLIRNGVVFRTGDRRKLRGSLRLADGDVLVVALGSLYPVKGHVVLLRALAALRDAAGSLPCHVAIAGRGGGDEEALLRRFAAEADIGSHTHLLGYRDDVGDILAAADVYAMPSLSEGLPLALLEAMGAGLPVVASRVGGIPEAATDGVDALLVPPADPVGLSVALRALIDDPARRAALGAAAARRATADFGVDRMVDAYEGLYETLRAR